MANHSLWYNDNPKRNSYLNKLDVTRSKITKKQEKGKHHTDEVKKKISDAALNSTCMWIYCVRYGQCDWNYKCLIFS